MNKWINKEMKNWINEEMNKQIPGRGFLVFLHFDFLKTSIYS